MKEALHVMLDLETWGKDPGCDLRSIGAVVIDFENETTGDTFYANIIPDSHGILYRDPETVAWWGDQSQEAQDALEIDQQPMDAALAKLTEWLEENQGHRELFIWGCGSAFDCVILRTAYQKVLGTVPWKFWSEVCYRTVRLLFPQQSVEREGTYHNALDDAITQAKHLIKILKGTTTTLS